MKYLFTITGIAYGHLTREEAIIKKLSDLDKNAEIRIASYGTVYNYFKGKHKLLKLEPMFWPDEFSRVQFFNTLIKNYRILISWIINVKRINKLAKENKIDLIVSDWEPFALFLKKCKYLVWNYKTKYAKSSNLIVLLEKILIESWYFILRIFKKKLIIPSFKREESSSNIIYTNLIVRKTPEEVKALKRCKEHIIVMIGGSNFGNNLAKKIEKISKNFDEKFIFFNYKCRSRNCTGYKKFRKDYLEYLKACKAVISLGGYSGISESIFFKKPNLAFPIKNWIEQTAVVEEFKDYIEIGNIESSEEELEIKIKDFLSNLKSIRNKLNKLNLKNGADEVAKILYKGSKRLPP